MAGAPLTQIVDDPYVDLDLPGGIRVGALAGMGSMGRVYRARQQGMERDIAVKILLREHMADAQIASRFRSEARIVGGLSHPNVVQMHGIGEVPAGAQVGGEAYLVMEYLDGSSLRAALSAAGGAFALPRALHIILQVCDAVGEAHAAGVIHRDLKPENIMLVRRGADDDFVKVLDFGLARTELADAGTRTGVVLGTARYVSPEGAEGARATASSDVYAIATMLFECLAGQTPFDADNPIGILVKQAMEPAPDLRAFPRASEVPEPIARVILANLAKDPRVRAPDARALGRAIVQEAIAAGLSSEELVLRATLVGSAESQAGRGRRHARESSSLLPAPPSNSTSSPPPSGRASAAHWEARPGSVHPPAARGRNAIRVGASFLAGVLLSVTIALAFGVFYDEASPDPGDYEARARAAIARGAFDSPRAENVLDLTTTALGRWPDHPGILAVRREAARELETRAAAAEPSEAERLARLALELDPDTRRAREILRATHTPEPDVQMSQGAAARQPRPEIPASTPPAADAFDPAEGPVDAAPPAPAPSRGRWL